MVQFGARLLAGLWWLLLLGASAGPDCPSDDQWNRSTDFGWSCRYRGDDARLIAARASVPVVFMGDSITELWVVRDPSLFGGGNVGRGISGQTTPQMVLRFDQDVIALEPRVVHIMAGTNDIAGNTGAMTLAQTEANIRTMAEAARAKGIRVVIGSVLPARAFLWKANLRPAVDIATLNQALRDYALRRGFGYADYYRALADSDGGMPAKYAKDGVHPTIEGYAVMRPIADAAIAAAISRSAP